MKALASAIATAALLSLSPALKASIVPSIDYTFGTGSESIFFVIDWNDGPDDNLNWQLDYSSGDFSSVYDAMVDLEGEDSNLTFDFTDFGGTLGQFLDGIEFNQASPPIAHNQNRGTGFAETFGFFTGDAGGNTWTSSGTGISGTPVADGEAYGFSWGASPQPEPNAAIPEPGMLFLALSGIGILVWIRRYRARR